jgi:hypothetical protein
MPPGTYRVAIELDRHRSDLLKGRFNADHSPFVFDLDAQSPEFAIDLAKPPASK